MTQCIKHPESERYKDTKCKECVRERARKYRMENIDAVKETNRIASKKYRIANVERKREQVRRSSRKAYWKNPEKAKVKYRKWSLANPDNESKRKIVRRMFHQRAIAKWIDRSKIRRLEETRHDLQFLTDIKWNIDHVVPLNSKFVCGLHVHTNLQLLPASINFSKGNREWPDMTDFARNRGHL